ncbi:MAG: DUF3298 domain-containing protein [Candidatus Colwellbacteria bacterium]|nr:DUF3298 domain-containing protein [Candidatus Colwellbacteria bacterium]
MDRKKLEIAAFVVIGTAILVIWGWQSLRTQTPGTEEDVLRTPEVREMKIEEETAQYKISASYPEFHNLGDPARERAANAAVKQEIEKATGGFKEYAKEAVDIIPEAKSELQITYATVYLNPSVASIRWSISSYIEGATHPLDVYTSFNYNFRDNKEIPLADLFNPDGNYLAKLSDLSRESLKNQLKDYYTEDVVEAGTEPRSENFGVFFLTRDKLILVFNVYSVAAYAAGAQTVEIPYDNLSALINPQGLIKLIQE